MLEYVVISVIIAFLLSTWLRQYVLRETEADVVDRANTSSFTASDHLISKRGSSRRKAFYKRSSPLSDYFEKNLSKTGDNVSFQSSGCAWKNYVAKSRHESKLADLDQSELKLYESIFELILTEKSYLMQLEQLTSFEETHPDLEKISKYDRNLLLGNIRHLYAVNNSLYNDFETAFAADVYMSAVFGVLSRYLTNGSLEPYIDYIKGHEERNRLINDEEKCEKVPELNKLRSLIIIPMQRVCRYPLLLQNIRGVLERILSKCPDSAVGRTLDRSVIDNCYEDASRFAGKCNKALADERKLFDLITFKKQLIGGVAIDDLVAPNREIYQRVTAKLYFVKQGTGGASPVPMPSYQGGSSLFRGTFNSMNKVKATLILLTDLVIVSEYKQKKDQYIVIDYEKLTQVTFDRRRDSIISTEGGSGGSSESINEKSDEGVGNGKARCLMTFKSTENSYGVTFLSMDEEEKFIKKLHQLKEDLGGSSSSRSPGTRSLNGF